VHVGPDQPAPKRAGRSRHGMPVLNR
jgi:hypothetical protein